MLVPRIGRAIALSTTFLLYAATAVAQSAPTLPAGPAGDALRAYFAAVDSRDSTRIFAWLKRYDPDGDLTVRTNRQMALARQTGGFTIERVTRAEPDVVEVIVRGRTGGGQLRFKFVMGPNGVAEGFGFGPVSGDDGAPKQPPSRPATPPAARPGEASQGDAPMPEAVLVRRLTSLVDSLTAAGQFSGVVSLSRRGAPVFEHAYGFANRSTRVPNTLETAFNLGSINKVFTATAIRQLAAAGKLVLDSTLAHAWPDYPNAEVARQVTIRQILEHRSGILGDIFAVPNVGAPREIRHNRQFLTAFVNRPLAFPPGSRQEYSNAGYVVLGGVIERVSGEDYYSYVKHHVYDLAGMSRTGHFANDSLPPRTALGYTRGGDNASAGAPLRPSAPLMPGRGSAAGGGYSTVGDLKKFLAALRAGRIPGAPPAGLGVAGGAEGLNAAVEAGLPGDYDLIVLANFDPPAAMRIARQVSAWLGARD
jgi:D-alanyl-D-alanine carboxypeptidase